MLQEPPCKHRTAGSPRLAGSLCHSQPEALSLCSGEAGGSNSSLENSLEPHVYSLARPPPQTVASKVCTSACHRQPNPKGLVAPGLLGSECLCPHDGTVSGMGLRGAGFRLVGGQDPPVRTVPLLGEKGSPLSARCHLEDVPAA